MAHNSNQKYTGIAPNAYEFEGFPRYRRPEGSFQTLDSYNNGRIPEIISMQRPLNNQQKIHYSSINMGRENSQNPVASNLTTHRGSSIDYAKQNNMGHNIS